MELTRCQPQQRNVHSRKRKRKGVDDNVGSNVKHSSDINGGIDKLPDDVLVNILSRTSIKEAMRASVLARRWRYLWTFFNGTLHFDHRDTSSGDVMERKKFESWVNTVVDFQQARYIEGMVISFEAKGEQFRINPTTYLAIDSWVHFAIQKEVRMFELNLSSHDLYIFPSVKRLILYSHGVTSPFRRLRALRLVNVRMVDEVVHYFLASCPDLEELCLHLSIDTSNLRVIDPPSLRVLEISKCSDIQSVEISAGNLVSLTYEGGKNSLLLKKVPNLRELTFSGDCCMSFVLEPREHWSYSVQLEKLVLDFRRLNSYRQIVAYTYLPQLWSLKRLEVHVFTATDRSLLFFTSLINASPQLCEFRIELSYMVSSSYWSSNNRILFPVIEAAAEVEKFAHGELKVVEIGGYIGCSNEKQLLLELLEICPSIERVVIDTESDYYDDPELGSCIRDRELPRPSWYPKQHFPEIGATTQDEAKRRAKRLASNLRKQVELIVT